MGRLVGDDLPATWFNLVRWRIAAAVLLPLLAPRLWRHRRAVVSAGAGLMTLSALGLVGFSTFLYPGLQQASVPAAALACAAAPFLVIVIDAIISVRTPSPWALLLSAVCFGGVFAVFGGAANLAAVPIMSLALLLGASACFAAYSVALRGLATRLPSAVSFMAQILLCLPMQIALACLWAPEFELSALTGSTLVAVGYIGVFAAAAAFLVWGEGMRRVSSEQAGAFLASVPVFAAPFSWILVGEAMSLPQMMMLGAVALCAAVMVGLRPKPLSASATRRPGG